MIENVFVAPGDEDSRFTHNMIEARQALGWSQSELARKMVEAGWEYFSQMTVSRTEKGERPLRLGEARAIARTFGLTLETMLGDDEASINNLQHLHSLDSEIRSMQREISDLRAKLSSLEQMLAQRQDEKQRLEASYSGRDVNQEVARKTAAAVMEGLTGWPAEGPHVGTAEDYAAEADYGVDSEAR